MRTYHLAAAIGLGLLSLGAPDARAQITSSSQPSARPVVSQDPDKALPPRPPRAVGLPGAQSAPGTAAPADRPPSEMRPTEALFDAINRGDITAARDAINRGAELHGRNILGFTPVEMAVDLGRNDIAFLLLSLRGMDGGSGQRAARPPSAADEARQEREAKAQAQREAQRAEAARRAAARVAPQQGPAVPAGQGPRLFAGDGGAPVPDAGFLGFGGASGGGRAGSGR